MPDSPLKPPTRSFASHLKDRNQVFIPHHHASGEMQRVGFILLKHFSMPAFTDAVDALVTANLLGPKSYEFITISANGEPVQSDLGIEIAVQASLAELKVADLDVMIVCGGLRVDLQADKALLRILKEASRKQVMLGGLWNGSYILAEAGLMGGYQCTLHPDNRVSMQECHPQVLLSKQAFVLDRDRLSCAGASSALEMMLAWIERDRGKRFATGIREILACDKEAELVDRQMTPATIKPLMPKALVTALELMDGNIEEPLALDEICNLAGLSRRQIERLFMRYIGATPHKYYMELRVTRARQLLLQTTDSVSSIAIACGFVSSTHFSHCFREYFGLSPTQVRLNLREAGEASDSNPSAEPE